MKHNKNMIAIQAATLKAMIISIMTLLIVFQSPVVGFEMVSLFSEDETLLLNHSDEQWQQALEEQRRIHKSSPKKSSHEKHKDVQPYTRKESSKMENTVARPVSDRGMGPLISIVNPSSQGEYYISSIPVQLLIYLKSTSSPIDIDSLRVKGKCGIFSLNVTSRVKPFMRNPVEGENADFVIDGKLPNMKTGKYRVVFSLADVNGVEEQRELLLKVE